MHYCRIPAGSLRSRFGFERLPDFDRSLWASVKASADRGIRPLPPGLISGSDMDGEAVDTARENLHRLPHGVNIALQRADIRRLRGLSERVIVCNPPYGIRLKDPSGMGEFYREIGDFLKQRCRGTTAFVYFGNREMLKYIGLKPTWKRPLKAGGLDGRLAKFEMY
jgi:putative N6-adenine-specific DNA methylase